MTNTVHGSEPLALQPTNEKCSWEDGDNFLLDHTEPAGCCACLCTLPNWDITRHALNLITTLALHDKASTVKVLSCIAYS